MEKKCDCYRIESKRKYAYHPITRQPIAHDIEVGVCYGTKEKDECSCGGDRFKCNFYSEVRENAKNDVTIEDAISHFKYGIDHDIFSEPVTTYAKMMVEALEKQIPKKVVSYSDDESDPVYCPCCNECIGSNENVWEDFYYRGWSPMYCDECGQAMIWE